MTSLPHHRLFRFAVLALAISLPAAACGGDDSPADETAASLTIDMVEFAFEPVNATVSAGQQVEVTVNNKGSIRHEWVVLQEGVRLEDEADKPDDEAVFQSDFVHFEIDLEAGLSETGTMTAPENPGTYQIVCAIPGHLSAGMVGELEVIDP